jgi:hypothetical protein
MKINTFSHIPNFSFTAAFCLIAGSLTANSVCAIETDVLTVEQWEKADQATERAIDWLRRQQRPDGGFPTLETAQPAVTALVTMAILSAGHGAESPDDKQIIEDACQFMLSCQQEDGLLARIPPRGECISLNASHTSNYNHSIAGICLAELTGSMGPILNKEIMKSLESALELTLEKQKRVLRFPEDRGGWRYATENYNVDSDVLVTAWHLMFLRAAKNAGFDVPHESAEQGHAFVKRCFDPVEGTFRYGLRGHEARQFSRSITGAGILSCALAGKHSDPDVQAAGEWLLQHPFPAYRSNDFHRDGPYFYGIFYGTQASYQLGGDAWSKYYPPVVKQLVDNQLDDGSWEVETTREGAVGRVYTTALAVLTLNVANELLPIYQR